jgi:hypothetical protein
MEMRFDTGQLRCVKGFTSWENPSTKFTEEREELKMMKSVAFDISLQGLAPLDVL